MLMRIHFSSSFASTRASSRGRCEMISTGGRNKSASLVACGDRVEAPSVASARILRRSSAESEAGFWSPQTLAR